MFPSRHREDGAEETCALHVIFNSLINLRIHSDYSSAISMSRHTFL